MELLFKVGPGLLFIWTRLSCEDRPSVIICQVMASKNWKNKRNNFMLSVSLSFRLLHSIQM